LRFSPVTQPWACWIEQQNSVGRPVSQRSTRRACCRSGSGSLANRHGGPPHSAGQVFTLSSFAAISSSPGGRPASTTPLTGTLARPGENPLPSARHPTARHILSQGLAHDRLNERSWPDNSCRKLGRKLMSLHGHHPISFSLLPPARRSQPPRPRYQQRAAPEASPHYARLPAAAPQVRTSTPEPAPHQDHPAQPAWM